MDNAHLDWESIKFGLLSTLKTGNMAIDTLICCMVPMLVSLALSQSIHIFKWWNEMAWPWICRVIFGDKDDKVPVFMRIINIKTPCAGAFYGGVQTDKTKQLMTAISLYVKTLKIKLPSADVSLVDIDEEGAQRNYLYGVQPDVNKDPFSNHEILWQPINGLWIKVSDEVEFQRQEEVVDNEGGKGLGGNGGGNGAGAGQANNKVTFSFRSYAKDGDKQIDDFLVMAFEWYKKEINARKDNTRYYYSYLARDLVKDQAGTPSNYKRFALSNEKDFSAVFFPNKHELLQLLENFKQKTGRYAIKGSQHKLGLLLHGPPGTGKTSFIKALASHFGRHIVSIPLSRIETNEELVDMLFDLNLKVVGSDYPVKLSYSQVIFIFEDIDAASDVVHKRSKQLVQPNKTTTVKITTKEHVVRKTVDLDGSGNIDNMKLDASHASRASARSRSSSGQNSSPNLGESAIGGGGPATLNSPLQEGGGGGLGFGNTGGEDSTLVTTVVREVSRGYADDGEDHMLAGFMSGESSDNEEELELSRSALRGGLSNGKKKMGPSKYFEKRDKLNLAGLLEVLDGVVDTPGRLIVMTTNRPEMLDAALVRPGRIDKKIKLDYLAAKEAVEMAEHFLGTMSSMDKAALSSVIKSQGADRVITPAVLEQACAEHMTPAALITALARLTRTEAM